MHDVDFLSPRCVHDSWTERGGRKGRRVGRCLERKSIAVTDNVFLQRSCDAARSILMDTWWKEIYSFLLF